MVSPSNVAQKYIKRILTRLEDHGIVNPVVRRIVMDGLNAMAREIASKE
jgi:hypothetical protein